MTDLDLNKIVLKDGQLFTTVGGEPLNHLLDLPAIVIVEKIGTKTGTGDTSEFTFRLSFHTCPHWRAILEKQVSIPVKFTGDRMTITCRPSDLQRVYASVKTAITQTNDEYAELRRSVIERVRERDRIAATRAGQVKEAEVRQRTDSQDAFDKLEL